MKTISIIGGTGKMGQLFANAFKKKGYSVIVAGRKTEISKIEAAKLGDIVIVTVPIRDTERVIAEIGPHVRKDALLTDFTSVKINPNKWMLKYSKSDVVAGHPLFGPSNDIKGKSFVIYPSRGKENYEDYKKLLKSIGLDIIEISPDEHDKIMGIVQCLNQISNLSFGYTLNKLNFDLKKSEKLATPNYSLRVYSTGRFLSQDKELVSDIQFYNPYSKKVAKIYFKVCKEIYRNIRWGRKANFEEIFEKVSNYFGDLKKESVEKTNKMINALYSRSN